MWLDRRAQLGAQRTCRRKRRLITFMPCNQDRPARLRRLSQHRPALPHQILVLIAVYVWTVNMCQRSAKQQYLMSGKDYGLCDRKFSRWASSINYGHNHRHSNRPWAGTCTPMSVLTLSSQQSQIGHLCQERSLSQWADCRSQWENLSAKDEWTITFTSPSGPDPGLVKNQPL